MKNVTLDEKSIVVSLVFLVCVFKYILILLPQVSSK